MEHDAIMRHDPRSYALIRTYPDGTQDIIAAEKPTFKPKGWEENKRRKSEKRGEILIGPPKLENIQRASQRARAKVRRIALANEFHWFVTLTFDPEKTDSYQPSEVVKRINTWCNNQVKRRGLRYILVPELHQSGRIHLHGFFNDVFPVVDSGHVDKQGHTIYNLPNWTWGFTTAVKLYGEYRAAVGYCCKYIGKEQMKIGGRWYYSGGDLREPLETYVDIDAQDLMREYGEKCWRMNTPQGLFVGINGNGETEHE